MIQQDFAKNRNLITTKSFLLLFNESRIPKEILNMSNQELSDFLKYKYTIRLKAMKRSHKHSIHQVKKNLKKYDMSENKLRNYVKAKSKKINNSACSHNNILKTYESIFGQSSKFKLIDISSTNHVLLEYGKYNI